MIIFRSEKALSFLRDKGFVYTLRARRRRTGRCAVKRGRKEPILFYADVYFVKQVTLDEKELESYAPYSGFESPNEWIEEYRRLNGTSEKPFLYKVVKRS